MLKNKFFILFFGLCVHLTSCKQQALNEKELYTYLKDENNGLIHQWKEDPFGISVMYKPSSLLAKQEIGNEIDLVKIQAIKERYNNYLYFVLNYSYKNGELLNAFGGNRPKFAELVNTLSFGMKEKVSILTDNKEKIPLADFIHSRHYGMGGGSKIVLIFDKNELLESTQSTFDFVLKDIGIGTGITKFNYKIKDIEQCPILIN